MIYRNGHVDYSKLEIGDVIEAVMMPCAPTLRGVTRPFEKWYFRIWRAEVVERDSKRVKFSPPTTEPVQPDDPRVLEYLKEEFSYKEGKFS